jgi:serine/threonine-protein kinase
VLTRAPVHSAPTTPITPRSDGRFAVGSVLAGRYRILGRLGEGGMGEVYRADDLTLGQTVALKFLPLGLGHDPSRMQRLAAEVRIARQITHANVCSVYDIEEVDGQRFISMEYVDGENLASLLRRIGRYSKDKAVEIARQVCAGLAAAHDRGVLHRDLKPANIMIDGRGKVRITDFGLASLAGQTKAAEIREGTPAYMAPEQLAGREVSVQSDIYALGLVLYELFTGRRVHDAATAEELLKSHSSGNIPSPSSRIDDMDPAAERIIMKCLEREPRDRPQSALAVAAALPGGDPLAAALAAGETPSPELVAGAGIEGALRPAVAWGLLGAACLLALAFVLGLSRLQITRWVDPPQPPAVLEAAARNVLRDLGYEAPAGDSASGFDQDSDSVRWIRDNDTSVERWERLRRIRPAPVYFWYRESPFSLVAKPSFARVTFDEPILQLAGATRLRLDGAGRLRTFEAEPPRHVAEPGPWADPDWSVLFAAAELDLATFESVAPEWTPRVPADRQVAWEGSVAAEPDVKLRVEAASYRGRLVSFHILGPWVKPPQSEPKPRGLTEWFAQNLALAVMVIGALVFAIVLAHRNVRAGRSDTRGALRLASFFFLLHTVVWALWASHVFDLGQEWRIVQGDFGYNLFLASNLWLIYVALEPWVRRRWPDAIIAWSRLLRGRFRDPLVGRDILIGGLFGAAFGLLQHLDDLLNLATGKPITAPADVNWEAFGSLTYSFGLVLDQSIHSLMRVMEGVFVLLLMRLVLRKVWLAGAAFVLLIGLMEGVPGGPTPILNFAQIALIVTLLLFVIVRYGLVAVAVGFYIGDLLEVVPLQLDLGAWYAPQVLLPMAAVLALLLYGFHVALAGQPVFAFGKLLEE